MKVARKVSGIALAILLVASGRAAEQAEMVTNTLPASAEAAWKVVQSGIRPPVFPPEWGGRPPSAEARDKFLGEKSAETAALAKEFYKRFPNDANAENAKKIEQRFLQQALAFGNTSVKEQAESSLTEEQKLKERINAAQRRALEKSAEGSAAVARKMEEEIRELMKEFPENPELWQQMLLVARNTLDKEEQKRILTDIVRSPAADEETIARAKAAIRAVGAVGHPLELSFTAVDGRKVDVQEMKGKVVLIDFWAAWCGPCIASLPEMERLHSKYKKEGFEIVGINMDKQQPAMEAVVDRFKMPWPQYFDGRGWGTKFALEYNVSAIPSVWLVDKAGILRTMEARENLEERIRELLAETH